MYLLVDLSTRDTIQLTLFDIHVIEHKSYSGKNRDTLFFVHDLLEHKGLLPKALLGIAIVSETGSFTSTRLAATFANTWKYARRIPVISVTKEHAECFEWMRDELEKKPQQYIVASYAAEPNIGKKKALT